MIIAGEVDEQANAISIRYRNGEQKNGISVEEAIAEISKVIADRSQV
jgi:threonyl-tRNA synthetase